MHITLFQAVQIQYEFLMTWYVRMLYCMPWHQLRLPGCPLAPFAPLEPGTPLTPSLPGIPSNPGIPGDPGTPSTTSTPVSKKEN